MVEFPVYGFDMTPHLASKHSNNMNHLPPENTNAVIMPNIGWSPWKRNSRKQSASSDNLYDLYAVIYHHGTDLETGHYTAACKNPYNSQWYLYDDAKVTNFGREVDDISTELVNNSAYILFYQKRYGVCVSSSSNTSSAASTSSIGSSWDHWVTRMPKFVPPKSIKTVERAPVVIMTACSDVVEKNTINAGDATVESNIVSSLWMKFARCSFIVIVAAFLARCVRLVFAAKM